MEKGPGRGLFFMEIVFEFIITFVLELFFDVGLRNISDSVALKEDSNKAISFIGYTFLAIFSALISMMLFPKHMIAIPELRILNICLTPVIAGTVMSLIGKRAKAKDKTIIKLDTFFYGWLFAFVFSLFRLIFAK